MGAVVREKHSLRAEFSGMAFRPLRAFGPDVVAQGNRHHGNRLGKRGTVPIKAPWLLQPFSNRRKTRGRFDRMGEGTDRNSTAGAGGGCLPPKAKGIRQPTGEFPPNPQGRGFPLGGEGTSTRRSPREAGFPGALSGGSANKEPNGSPWPRSRRGPFLRARRPSRSFPRRGGRLRPCRSAFRISCWPWSGRGTDRHGPCGIR